MNIVYSYNKKGYEGERWSAEIAAASSERFRFIPFNHQYYLDPRLYDDSVKLDMLYQNKNPELMRLYRDFERLLVECKADAVIVANCPPYHPDYLKRLSVYKALFSADDPGATYMINIPYLHAYNHVFFVAPSYSADMDMSQKMHYAGMTNADWLPISVFDFEFEPQKQRESVFSQERDIDIIYIGSFWRQKVDTLVKVSRAFGNNFKICGFFRTKHNIYLNARHGLHRWIKPVSHQQRVNLYQRAKIGINIHWSNFGLGNQRLYHLPANGVMQICDCASFLSRVFEPNREIVAYEDADELVENIRYYLGHEQERVEIAKAGYDRTLRQYRFGAVCQRAAELIESGIRGRSV